MVNSKLKSLLAREDMIVSFLQIASWNIEHLSGHPRKDRKQSAFAIADHIEMSGIHIMALQEVYVTPDDEELRIFEGGPIIERKTNGERRNSDLDIVCYILEEHLKDPWSYVILQNRSPNDRSQLCAVLWNNERVTLDNILPINVEHKHENDNLWDRKPHLLSFTSTQRVWRRDGEGEWQQVDESRRLSLIPLHMKSNYGGVTVNRRIRAKEAETLYNTLTQMSGQYDPTLILIGDTNILSNSEPAIEKFIEFGLIDLNNDDSGTYWSPQYSEAPFDRAFVARDRKEFQYTRQYVLKSSDLFAHDKYLSDHYIIKISIKDYVDDVDTHRD